MGHMQSFVSIAHQPPLTSGWDEEKICHIFEAIAALLGVQFVFFNF
jgi:hypothetical protein